MIKKSSHTIFLVCVATVLGFIFIVSQGCRKREDAGPPSFEDHPIYKNYRFSNDEKVIEIGVPSPWSSVNQIIEVMKRDRVFTEELAKAGFSARFYPFLKGEDVNYFIKKGLLEVSVVGDMPMLRSASEGDITVMSIFSRGSVSLVSRDIYRVKDLKNKRVAYPYGSNSHYYLLRLLRENSMSENDIRHRPMDTTFMLDSISGRKIDAFTTFEPSATIYTKMDPTLHMIQRSFSSYAFLNVRKDFGIRHPEAVRTIIAAQIRAILWLREADRNLEKASEWAAEDSLKITSLPIGRYLRVMNQIALEDITVNTDMDTFAIGRDITATGGEINREFEFLKAKGFVPRDTDWSEVVKRFDGSTALEVIKKMGQAR